MGMFDSVYFDCPECQAPIECQSKAGECFLENYPPDKVPIDVANDIMGDIIWCPNSHGPFSAVKSDYQPATVSLKLVANLPKPEGLTNAEWDLVLDLRKKQSVY